MKKSTLLFATLLFSLCVNAQQWGLYTLYANTNSTTGYLIDTTGATYKSWTFSSSKKTGYSCYMNANKQLVRTVSYSGNVLGGGGMTGEVQITNWNGASAWDFIYSSSTYCLHHDVCQLPNGNVLMISYDVKTSAQATQAGASSASTGIWSEKIIEVQPTGATTGTIVWEWKLWDHMCQEYNSSKDNYVTDVLDHPELMDINCTSGKDRYHMNGIDYNEALDQIVVSMHYTNEIYVIDHSTTTAEAATHSGGNSGKGGDFLYRWGCPANYDATGTTIFNVIHDAHWVPSNNPNYPNYLCAYNNKGGTGGKSAFTIWNPPYNGSNYNYTAGQAYLPGTYAYQYTGTFTANDLGNSQQLPNGNVIFNNPMGGIYELNSGGTIIWSKTGTQSAHAYRFDKCFVRGPVASLTANPASISSGQTVTLNATAVSVTETSPSYSYAWSSSPAGFSSTAASPTDAPTVTTTYTVTITNTTLGCSDEASVTVTVGPTGIDNATTTLSLNVYPNPTTGEVNISGNILDNTEYTVIIYDLYGKEILREANSSRISMADRPSGFYYLTVQTGENGRATRKISLLR